MRRCFLGSTLLLALVALTADRAPAQNPSNPFGATPYQSPISPYLNQLLGRNAGVNYYQATAPFTQAQRFDARSIYQDITTQRRQYLEGPEDQLIPENPPTGHAVRF